MSVRRVVSWARHASGPQTYPALAMSPDIGDEIAAGREADLPVGIDPDDVGVSRLALSITAHETGWELRVTNRNGAVLHRWGQAPTMLDLERPVHLRWPRAGIRLLGKNPDVEHWVLLEADEYMLAMPGGVSGEASPGTHISTAPRPLTDAQRDALTTVFAQHLEWPPITHPMAMARETAGRRLGISYAGIVDRLHGAQRKAHQLGSNQQFGLMEPDYLYVLVARGYLTPPVTHVEAEDLG
jgi:hypothetical protein